MPYMILVGGRWRPPALLGIHDIEHCYFSWSVEWQALTMDRPVGGDTAGQGCGAFW